VNGNAFSDSRGFTCDTYEGAGWCKTNDDEADTSQSDLALMGDGWCKRWPRSDYEKDGPSTCKVMPGRKRMYSFGHYANDDGIDARACCCDSGIADSYPYNLGFDNPGTCNDKKWDRLTKWFGDEWHDKNGWTCKVYHYGNLCNSDGTRGDGWNNAEWGQIQSHTLGNMHAKDACCACGGGEYEPNYDELPGIPLRRMNRHIAETPRTRGTWSRIRKFSRQIVVKEKDGLAHYDPAKLQLVDDMYKLAQNGKQYDTRWDEMMVLWNDLVALMPADMDWLIGN